MKVINNVIIVLYCLMIKEEWDNVVKRKKCGNFLVKENFIVDGKEQDYMYYCFINLFLNEILEVCVYLKIILGNIICCCILVV